MIETIAQLGVESLGRYYSIYRGVVTDNEDPEKCNRLKVYVPSLGVYIEEWAYPRNQHGAPDGSGFKYKDVVSWEGKYYLYVGTTDIHKISGVSPTPKDSETLNAGWQIYDGGLFGDLIANYIFAKSISAN